MENEVTEQSGNFDKKSLYIIVSAFSLSWLPFLITKFVT